MVVRMCTTVGVTASAAVEKSPGATVGPLPVRAAKRPVMVGVGADSLKNNVPVIEPQQVVSGQRDYTRQECHQC